MFKSKRRQQPTLEEMLAAIQPPEIHNRVVVTQDSELRPCYVNGRKALFHRWVNTARPQLPKGQELSENARFYQFRATTGLVEYEDGTIDQVWPRDIKFADHGRFRDYAWDPAEEESPW